MNTQNYAHGTRKSLYRRAGRIALALIFLHSMTLSPAVWAGAFIFAGEGNGVDLILHPSGYNGTGGDLTIGVCIDPASLNAQDLVIPVKNNISVWNDLQPVESNVQLNVVNGIDAESVLLHEMGHCIGLAHVNAASESGLSQNDYTKATDGANNSFDVNAGPDGVIGSHDDIRGDDVNLHWFNPANDPFQLPIHTPVDTTQYKRDTAALPAGDSFAQNGSRSVAIAMGYPYSESVMQQGTYGGETQRELSSDGVSTVLLAASGIDETAGTSDDYNIVLTYEGITTGSNCDITVIMEQMNGLAYCSVGGTFIGNNHARITSASIHLGAGYTYTFNTVLRDSGGNQAPVANNDSGSVNEDGSVDIAVLGNDSDPDDDPLDVTSVSNPPNGSASVNANNTIRYVPDSNYNGTDSFSYTLADDNGGTDTGNVNVTVTPVNDFPEAENDSGITTAQDTPVDIDVLLNDSDVDGDILNVATVSDGAKGTVSNHDSYVTYQPNPGVSGTDSFTYTASDGNGGTDNATVTVDVQADDPPPVAQEVFYDSFENGQWNGQWNEDSQNDWFTSSQRATDGSQSAEVDGNANDAQLVSIPINLQGHTSATISFNWFIEKSLDTGEYLAFDVSTNNGGSWVQQAILRGNADQENTWHSVQVELDGINNLQLRFRAKISSSREDANVDEVRVVAGGGSEPPANQDPTAAFSESCSDLACNFTDGSSDSDGSVVSWSWNFGDGSSSSQRNPGHTYSSDGTYLVSLTVTDNGGATDTTSHNVTVEADSGGGPLEVFYDSFENGEWNGNWSEDSQNDWFTSTQRSTDGSSSAEVDGSAVDAELISVPIDLQGRSSASISFNWYLERRIDAGEYLAFDVSTNGGSSWTERAVLRGDVDPERVWVPVQVDLNGISSLRLRFRGTMSGNGEDANLDEVRVIAQ